MINPQTSREYAELERATAELNTPRAGEKWAPADFIATAPEPRAFVPCDWQEGDTF